MSTERPLESDKALWRSLATSPADASTVVSDLDFAAWLEGRLPEREAARLDAAIAADPEMRRAALELADILGRPLPAAPPRLVVRGQALVGFEAERRVGRSNAGRRGNWIASLLPDFRAGFSLQRGAMAGAAVMLATVGFMMGGGLGESFAHQRYASAVSTGITLARPLGSETTNELADLFSDPT
jgi:hypothetical protein